MKLPVNLYPKRIKLLSIFLFVSCFSFGQFVAPPLIKDCLDFTEANSKLMDFNFDNNYPPGSIIITEGNLNVIKPYTSVWGAENTTIFSSSGSNNSFLYSNWIYFDVSQVDDSECDKTLYLNTTSEFIVVDGDTAITPFSFYEGENFDIGRSFHEKYFYSISGAFDTVKIGASPQGLLTEACLVYSSCNSPLNIQDEKEILVSQVYPNPSSGDVYLNLTQPNSQVQIYNAIGELVVSEIVPSLGVKIFSLNTAGVYVVSITSNGANENHQVIIK